MLKMSLARVSSYVRGVRHLGVDSHTGWHVRAFCTTCTHIDVHVRAASVVHIHIRTFIYTRNGRVQEGGLQVVVRRGDN